MTNIFQNVAKQGADGLGIITMDEKSSSPVQRPQLR